MLWYKAWLETRARFLMLAVVTALSAWYLSPEVLRAMLARGKSTALPGTYTVVSLRFGWMIWPMIAVLMAGAGINTQTFRGVTHGVHPSMLFTLSLPVRRRRLMGVRATAGAIEAIVLIAVSCLVLWTISADLRLRAGWKGLAFYLLTTIVAVSVFYCVSLLLATFLDESWHSNSVFLMLGAIVMLREVPFRNPISALVASFANVNAILQGQLPWGAMACCGLISAVLVLAAAAVVERKRY